MRLLKNCTNRRHSLQMLWPEGNEQPILKTDLKTRCSGGEGYSSATPFSQRARNMLSSGFCPHTEKVTTKTAFWFWWSSKNKIRKELTFFEHQNIEFNMLLTKPPFPKQGSFVCTRGQPCTWLSWSKLHRTVITCFYVSLSQETLSSVRTSDFPNTVFDMWMNEWRNEGMKLTLRAYIFFTTGWQIVIGKSNSKLSQKQSRWKTKQVFQ